MIELNYIDHYDSFSLNLIDWLYSSSRHVRVQKYNFDDPGLLNQLQSNPKPIVLSPGPKSPREAEETQKIALKFMGKVPILGVCLGHQVLGNICGADIIQSVQPIHGKKQPLKRRGFSRLLHSLPKEFSVSRYNSLVVSGLDSNISITAENEHGEIMAFEGLTSGDSPFMGIQFHPESFIAGIESDAILENWLKIAFDWQRKTESSMVTGKSFNLASESVHV